MSTSTPRPTERRTLHFDLSHTRPGAEHTLHAGGRRHVLKSHTDTTRRRHRATLRVLAVVPDERLTHYLEAVDFPETAVQSFYVTHPHEQPNGLPRLSLMAIHVPQQALQRLTLPVRQPGALYVTKAKRLGLDGGPAGPRPAEPMDLADYVDMTEAAKLIVFHHPELISLDPHTSATTLAYIENVPSFHALVRSLNDQGQGQRPGGDYEGWVNGEYLLDTQGEKIPDGKGGYRWKYVYTAETRNFMRPVVQQALLRVRDDPQMEGISFATHYGTHNVRNAPSPRPAPAAVRAAARPEPASPYVYKLDDTDWRAGRQVVITEVKERDLTITVNNSYFRYLGISARYLKYNDVGRLVPLKLADLGGEYTASKLDGIYVNFLGKVDDRPRLMGIPIKAQEEAEFTVKLPPAAQAVDILCGGLGLGVPLDIYERAHVPGSVLTAVLNLAVPGFFLLLGVPSGLIESEGKKLLVDLAKWLVDVFTGLVVRLGLFGGGYSQDAVGVSWAMDIFNSLIKEGPKEIVDLLAFAAAVSAEEALEECLPVVGLVLEAVGVVATVAELATTAIDIALSPLVIPARITSTLSIGVTIKPDRAAYQFPASASQYRLIAHLTSTLKWDSGWLAFDASHFDPRQNTFPTYTFSAIPAGGDVEVTVQFISATGWVAAYGTTGKVPNIVPKDKERIELELVITENLVPLSTSTVYQHRRKLGIQPGGAHHWIETTERPAATRADLGGNGIVTLEDLTNAQITLNMHTVRESNVAVLGYSWQGKSPTLGKCDGGGGTSTPLYTMQSIQLGTATPDALLKVLKCGFTPPLMTTYDLIAPATGGNLVVAMAQDGVAAGGQPQSHYHVRKLDLTGPGDIDLSVLPSWGRFASPKIGSIAAHGDEFVLALSPDLEMVEILRLPKQPYGKDTEAEYASQIGKEGSYVGLLKGSRAMALSRDGNTFLVLEETNNRIQAFNTNGVVVKYFGGTASEVPLRQWPEDADKQITYLDMSLEYGGHLYVLSYEGAGDAPNHYRLDIYDPRGMKLARTRGVPAARLVVDQWRAVYTLNFELLTGPNQRPEPSVSLWATSG